MVVILVPHADVAVDMNDSDFSSTSISTDYLGPCLCFLLDMKYLGNNVCFISHYSFSINEKNLSPSQLLIKILQYLINELKRAFRIKTVVSKEGESYFTNCILFVTGGVASECKNMHNAISLLNEDDDKFDIKQECQNSTIRFLYYQLKKRVLIMKTVTKMLSEKEESVAASEEVGNDYACSYMRYCCQTKNITIGLTWTVNANQDIAFFQMNLHSHDLSDFQWELESDKIHDLKISFNHEKTLKHRFKQVLALIPKTDPFVTFPPNLHNLLHSSNIKIGINGFNRISQFVLRCALEQGVQVIAVNDPNVSDCLPSAELMVDKLKLDSANAYFKGEVFNKDKFIVGGQLITAFTGQGPTYIPPWGELGVEYVVETTCKYTTIDECKSHIQSGAKRVIITTLSDDAPMFVMGINENKYTGKETILSIMSCTTANCLAPLVGVVHEKFGITEALITSLSSFIREQKTVNEPSDKSRRSREAEQNILFANTIAIDKAIGKIFPDLNEKLTGTSFIFSTLNVSLIDLTARLKKGTTYEEICAAIRAAANGPLKNILAYSDDNSIPTHDIVDTHSLIFYARAGVLLKDSLVKLVVRCNNEYGDANRVMDLIKYIFIKDHQD